MPAFTGAESLLSLVNGNTPLPPLKHPACDSQGGESAGQVNDTESSLQNEASCSQSHKDSSLFFPFLFLFITPKCQNFSEVHD